jgi:predicted transcriptional regulator
MVALFASVMQTDFMSDKELALETIQRLPANATLSAIAERLEFLAAIHQGHEQIEHGETIPHDEAKRQLATWLSK